MMKTNIKKLAAAVSTALLIVGGNPAGHAAAPAPLKKIAGASKTSYSAVTSKLDRGGNVFGYLGTAKFLGELSGKAEELWKSIRELIPENEREEADQVYDFTLRLLQKSGAQEISGVGISTVPIGEDLYRSKLFIHHNKGAGNGYVWSMFGDGAHELTGLDVIPADAVIASYGDMNVAKAWTTLTNELASIDRPEVQQGIAMLPMQVEMMTQMKLGDILSGIGGEFGWALMLNDKVRLPLPIPSEQGVDMPTPELLLIAKVTNKALFDKISEFMSGIPNVMKVEQDGVHQVRVPALIPFVPALQPVVAFDGEHLFVTSNPMLVNRVIGVKKGEEPSLRTNEQFKELAAGLIPRGNTFGFVSDRFAKEISEIQRKAMPKNDDIDPADMKKVMNLFGKPTRSLSVFSNTDEGWLWTTVGNQSLGDVVTVGLAAGIGVGAAIAIPNFVKTRVTAQKNSCEANRKMLDGAVQMWAIDNKKKADDAPNLAGILKYLNDKKMPECPAGGRYKLPGKISGQITCSHSGHSDSGWSADVAKPMPAPAPPPATGARNACIANLKQLDGATQIWALENKKIATDKPELPAVLKYLRNAKLPACPAGGKYQLGDTVSATPTCSHPGHKL